MSFRPAYDRISAIAFCAAFWWAVAAFLTTCSMGRP